MAVWTGTPFDATAYGALTAADWDGSVRDGFTAFGALTAYTPTLTNWTLGNGTITGGYGQVQKRVFFYASLTFGSTTAAAASSPTFTLPVTASNANISGHLDGLFLDASASAVYGAGAYAGNTTTVGLYVKGTNDVYNAPSTTSPFTWTTSDVIVVRGWYWAA